MFGLDLICVWIEFDLCLDLIRLTFGFILREFDILFGFDFCLD